MFPGRKRDAARVLGTQSQPAVMPGVELSEQEFTEACRQKECGNQLFRAGELQQALAACTAGAPIALLSRHA